MLGPPRIAGLRAGSSSGPLWDRQAPNWLFSLDPLERPVSAPALISSSCSSVSPRLPRLCSFCFLSSPYSLCAFAPLRAIFLSTQAVCFRPLFSRAVQNKEFPMKATSFPVTEPRRIEVNLAADLQRLAGETYSYVRNLSVWARDAYVDDFRISAGYTVERNSLLPGAVAHIASTRSFTPTSAGNGSPRYSDSYLHYDHIGNVLGLSSSSGSLSSSFSQDAWGNVIEDSSTGEWSASFSGRHQTAKEYDPDVQLYYFWKRWSSPSSGIFIASSPLPAFREARYVFCYNSPVMFADPLGLEGWWEPPMFPGDPPTYIELPPGNGPGTPMPSMTNVDPLCYSVCMLSCFIGFGQSGVAAACQKPCSSLSKPWCWSCLAAMELFTFLACDNGCKAYCDCNSSNKPSGPIQPPSVPIP